jgi:hypothetical protein
LAEVTTQTEQSNKVLLGKEGKYLTFALAKPINRKALLEVIRKYLPPKSKALSERIDSVKTQA